MMKNKGLIFKIGIPLLIVAVVFYFYFINSSKYNWVENYKSESKEPYGCFVISEMLKAQKDADFKKLETSLEKTLRTNRKNQTYVFIGEQVFYSDAEQDSLIRFISEGNHAFIAAKWIPTFILDTIFNQTGCYEPVNGADYYTEYLKEGIKANLYEERIQNQNGYDYSYIVKNDTFDYNWHYLDGNHFCDSAKQLYWISYIDQHYVNCVTSRIGEGTITIHTNPVMFTNMMMKDPQHFEYADKIFSHVKLENIIWDDKSKFPYFNNQDPTASTPLKYILSQPALKAGWYTLLGLALLYVLFRAKRRVRTIPVIEPKTNNSLAFLKAVSSLFQRAGNHKRMAELKMKFFLSFIREHYNYTPEFIARPDFHEALSMRSGVDKDHIKTIFTEYNTIKEMNDINSFRLENFNNLIHQFYVRCR